MGLAEDRIEKKRKDILGRLTHNGFSKEGEETVEDERREIYAKNGERIILGGKVTYIIGNIKEVMDYDYAADYFFKHYYSPPPSFLENSLGLIKKSKEYIASNLLGKVA